MPEHWSGSDVTDACEGGQIIAEVLTHMNGAEERRRNVAGSQSFCSSDALTHKQTRDSDLLWPQNAELERLKNST
jgi:hypothetical protein